MTEPNAFPAIRRLLEARAPEERLPEGVAALAAGIDRGHHLALVAGEGARLCRLYSAAAIQDLGEHDEARAMVLAATPDRARRLARAIERVGRACGWATVLWSPDRDGTETPPSRAVVVGTPTQMLAGVRAGSLSLGNVRLLVLDDVAALSEAWPAVEGILQGAEGEVRRIAVTHRRDAEFDSLVERLLPRARRWPREIFDLAPDERPAREGPPVRYATAPSHDERLMILVDMLHEWRAEAGVEGVRVWCADHGTAASVAAALAIEDLPGEEHGIRVGTFDQAPSGDEGPPAPAVAFGLPWTLDEMQAALGGATKRAAVVEPRHGRHLEILSERAGWPVRPLPVRRRTDPGDLGAFRGRIDEAIGSRDLATGTLLIAPLIDAHGYERVSAALAALLREADRASGTPEDAGAPAADANRPAERPAAGVSRDARRAAAPAWSKVFVNVGRQDGAAPGDFVGAITGETGAAGAQIGKIEIRQKFTLIDIDSLIVDQVVRGLNGKQIKGRDVVARLDRK